ncbi:bifunctional folylpolyglutamate synthase/dihydrofolate synthase [Robiginitalea sp. M366]|uniref:bifunctional folylpolyglutamate synthase/dihydrofolate synthase n=1 Tax=Robiginitalea aestuariiviva TaxID=3036903 RepID=UPI00240D2062|nr:folylpolyglutamate synthase/dihydrofolate synthase family protein [Robiginitalea aestuariiviva]MDG1572003.1 bifunctional folylpolyglutamate synthase/dihydrofolate synthase [Robiginitalea aestuariiviva]
MDYRQTLDWMFARLPMYQQRGAAAYSGKLEPIRHFTAYLGHPQNEFKSLHIAGTNGKGSSSHMLASVLQEAGYKVGLYTSPHLKDFRERIRVGGIPVSEAFVVEFIRDHKDYIEKAGLSFFELTVGMAFACFAARKVDLAVVEVGLGGRLDATNIIRPEVGLITNIGLDHTEFLGEDPLQIAKEKAGIIKEGVPIVVSETQPGVDGVFREVAAARHAPLTFADQQAWPEYPLSLLGEYQQKNVKGVLAVLSLLKGFPLTEEDIAQGLMHVQKNTGLLGRWQILQEHPRVLCDTAHNLEGLELVMAQLKAQRYRQLHLVLAFVKGKPLDQLLPLLPQDGLYHIAPMAIPRGMPVAALAYALDDHGLDYREYPSIPQAYRAALEQASPEDLVFVGGSTFTVAEVL